MSSILLPRSMSVACILLFAAAAASPASDVKTHTELATTGRAKYAVQMGGTMDGVNTRSPIGYGVWSQAFEPNVSVRMENVGKADVVNPWVIVNGRRDWRTVESIAAEATVGRTTEKEKAIGIWQFEIGNRFHWTTSTAENLDPVKVFNVYGYTLCGNDAHVISDLWRTAGFKVRRGFPQGHCTTEVFYNGRYHHLDGDESIICLLRDNETVANEAETVRDHDLMKRTHTYGVLHSDSRQTDEFSASLCVYEGHRQGEHRSHIRHKMHFTLRPGETLEWRWDNAGKVHSNWTGNKIPTHLRERICNGRMFYTPQLPDVSKQNGTVWKIESPYVIVGAKLNGTLVRPSKEAQCKLALSFDQKRWKDVLVTEVGSRSQEITLDAQFPSNLARYAYFVKLDSAGGGGVRDLRFESVLQMAPLSLPALEVGENRVAYVSDTKGPQKVKITHTWRESSASGPPAAPPKAIFPEDGASVDGTQFTFKWAAPIDPDGHEIADHHFQLSRRADLLWHLSPNFNKLVSRTKDKGKPQYAMPYKGLLNPGQTYYWRVRAQDAKGVWSSWSKTWSFTPQGPGVPLSVRARADRAKRTVTLYWSANSKGRRPVKYRIYGSDEKGFTASDEPYEILWRSIQSQTHVPGKREMLTTPSNFACETASTKLVVVGPELTFPNANKAYYRVVAVDEQGLESGPSDYAAIPRPVIYTLPPAPPRVGQEWQYQVKATSSIGDLRCRTFVPGKYIYNAGFWDQDVLHYRLHRAPEWLKIDEMSGTISGTPTEKAIGKHSFLVYADIPKVSCDSQTITLEVKAK